MEEKFLKSGFGVVECGRGWNVFGVQGYDQKLCSTHGECRVARGCLIAWTHQGKLQGFKFSSISLLNP